MLKLLSSMLCTSETHSFFNWEYWELNDIYRVASVGWTWLGLKWPPT